MNIDKAFRALRTIGQVSVAMLENGYRVVGVIDGGYNYDYKADTLEAAATGALQIVRKRLAEKQQRTVASLAAVTGQIAVIDQVSEGAS